MALNSNLTLGVVRPPDFEKNGTNLVTCPEPPAAPTDTTANSLPSATFDPVGSVTPVADTDNWPVPSESNIAPPRSIVCPSRNNSLNLFDVLPKFLVPLPSGIMSWSTAEKSAEPNATIEPLLFTNIFFCTGLIPTSPTSKSLVVGSSEAAVNLFYFIFNTINYRPLGL